MSETNTTVIKPASILREEFINNLIRMTNESNLPCFVIEYIMKDFLNELHAASQQQLESDKQNYQKELSETTKKQ